MSSRLRNQELGLAETSFADEGDATPPGSVLVDGIPSRLAKHLRPGNIIDGKYRVEAILGTGGMGAVVAAEHLHLKQRVAIKVLLPSLARDEEHVARFIREARAAAQLRDEHVVRILDVDILEDGNPYIVMECLEGEDLARVLAQRGPLPIEEAVGYVLQACEALGEAHQKSVVHRDIKPSNLFLTRSPDGYCLVKVLDFGISKLKTKPDMLAVSKEITGSAQVLGSPLYMAPEQLRNPKSVDARADVWALGLVLYELITGVLPHQGELFTAICAAIVADLPAPMRTRRSDVPRALDEVVLKCLQKKADDRFPSAAALADALLPFTSVDHRLSIEQRGRRISAAPAWDSGRLSPPIEHVRVGLLPAAIASMDRIIGRGRGSQTRARRMRLGAVGLGGFAIAAVLGLIWGSPTRPVPARHSDVARFLALAAVPREQPQQHADGIVSIRMSATPSEARLELDGVVLTDTVVRMPRSGQRKRIVISAPGYIPLVHEFTPSVDGQLVFDLEPIRRDGAINHRPKQRPARVKGRVPNLGPIEKDL